MRFEGTVHKYGDNVDTDAVIPTAWCHTMDPAVLGQHCMENWDPEFTRRAKPGDIIVGGENFGCGSSREHAPVAIKGAQVACVVAASFARIFFRNALNIGLPIVVCPEAARAAQSGDQMVVDLGTGTVSVRGATYRAEPFPEFAQQLIAQGGLVNYVRARLGAGAGRS